MNIHYGILYPGHLIITHENKRLIFKTVKEAEDYIQNLYPATRSPSSHMQTCENLITLFLFTSNGRKVCSVCLLYAGEFKPQLGTL